jgi:hypothetical protein
MDTINLSSFYDLPSIPQTVSAELKADGDGFGNYSSCLAYWRRNRFPLLLSLDAELLSAMAPHSRGKDRPVIPPPKY